jgi:hypothetical protein
MGSAATLRLLLCAVIACVALGGAGAVGKASAGPKAAPLAVHVIYAVPPDRPARANFAHAINSAILDLQAWYLGQVGKTFAIASPAPSVCHLPHPNAYYAVNTWEKVREGVLHCGNVVTDEQATAKAIWVVYADVDHKCNAPGPIGLGATGLAELGRQDMNGLTGGKYVSDCGEPFTLPVGRYVGGLGHELGHAFGLPHPPGCDQGLPSCAKNANAIMWLGYVTWPNTYLTAAEKGWLRKDKFFRLTKSIRPVIHGGDGQTASSPPTGGCKSGSFSGETDQGQTVSFTVACAKGGGGTITNLTFARVYETCSPSGSQATVGPLQFSTAKLGSDGSFTIAAASAITMHITGHISAGQASGTISADGPSPSGSTCSSGTVNWTATG